MPILGMVSRDTMFSEVQRSYFELSEVLGFVSKAQLEIAQPKPSSGVYGGARSAPLKQGTKWDDFIKTFCSLCHARDSLCLQAA